MSCQEGDWLKPQRSFLSLRFKPMGAFDSQKRGAQISSPVLSPRAWGIVKNRINRDHNIPTYKKLYGQCLSYFTGKIINRESDSDLNTRLGMLWFLLIFIFTAPHALGDNTWGEQRKMQIWSKSSLKFKDSI
jgi:hypothetical protein